MIEKLYGKNQLTGKEWEEIRKELNKKTKTHSIRSISGRTKIKQAIIKRLIAEDKKMPVELIREIADGIVEKECGPEKPLAKKKGKKQKDLTTGVIEIENHLENSIVVTYKDGKLIIHGDVRIPNGTHIFGVRYRYIESSVKNADTIYDSKKVKI